MVIVVILLIIVIIIVSTFITIIHYQYCCHNCRFCIYRHGDHNCDLFPRPPPFLFSFFYPLLSPPFLTPRFYPPSLPPVPVACNAGFFSSAGSTSCTYCQPGYYCPTPKTSIMTNCTSGTYSLGEKRERTPTRVRCCFIQNILI